MISFWIALFIAFAVVLGLGSIVIIPWYINRFGVWINLQPDIIDALESGIVEDSYDVLKIDRTKNRVKVRKKK